MEEAYDILNRLADEKYGILIYMKVEKDQFQSISSAGRYQQLLKKMNLD
jgi:hypothetical protein